MDLHDALSRPDPHLRSEVAASYDDAHLPRDAAAAVALLRELADDGAAVEFAIGTGRIALPLSATGVPVLGVDVSEPMLDQLRAKPGADTVQISHGDMTDTLLCTDAALVYLVFNTIMNLRSQEQQVACFGNAAAHLRPGGRFVIETMLPEIHLLAPGETVRPFDVSADHLGFDEYLDRVGQILVSHHYFVDGDRVRVSANAFRYVWPSELDLMAQLAGLELESRWADWDRSPFTDDSTSHVSVWRKPVRGDVRRP